MMRNHTKLFRALLWFIAAGVFIFAILTADEEDYNARHGIVPDSAQEQQVEE